MLDKNRGFYWEVELLPRIIYYDRLKQQMETINGEYKDIYSVVYSMEQMSNIFAMTCDNKILYRVI